MNHDKNSGDRTLRVCENCRQRKPREFGQYVPITKLTQKWLCASCFDLRNRR